jgi:hypothetical protein
VLVHCIYQGLRQATKDNYDKYKHFIIAEGRKYSSEKHQGHGMGIMCTPMSRHKVHVCGQEGNNVYIHYIVTEQYSCLADIIYVCFPLLCR